MMACSNIHRIAMCPLCVYRYASSHRHLREWEEEAEGDFFPFRLIKEYSLNIYFKIVAF